VSALRRKERRERDDPGGSALAALSG
jgi:hypothetical protein